MLTSTPDFTEDTFMMVSQQFFVQSALADRYEPQNPMCKSITTDVNY